MTCWQYWVLSTLHACCTEYITCLLYIICTSLYAVQYAVHHDCIATPIVGGQESWTRDEEDRGVGQDWCLGSSGTIIISQCTQYKYPALVIYFFWIAKDHYDSFLIRNILHILSFSDSLFIIFQTYFVLYLLVGARWVVLHNKANCRDCDQALISNALCALIPPSLEKCFCCDFARLDAGNWAGGRWRCWLVSKSENNGMGQPLVPPGMVAPKPFLWEAAFHLLQISARSMHCSSQLIFASSSATIEAFTGLLQE